MLGSLSTKKTKKLTELGPAQHPLVLRSSRMILSLGKMSFPNFCDIHPPIPPSYFLFVAFLIYNIFQKVKQNLKR